MSWMAMWFLTSTGVCVGVVLGRGVDAIYTPRRKRKLLEVAALPQARVVTR